MFNIYVAGDAVANTLKGALIWVASTKADENPDCKFHFILLID